MKKEEKVAQFNRLKYLLVEQADMGSTPIAIGWGGDMDVDSIHGSNTAGSIPALPIIHLYNGIIYNK